MAFDIYGPRTSVAIDGADEHIFEKLPRTLGLVTPVIDGLWRDFYSNPKLPSVEQVEWLRREVVALRDGYRQRRREELIRERSIRARDPHVVDEIVAPMLRGDAVLRKCEEIVAVCDEAIAEGRGLVCASD